MAAAVRREQVMSPGRFVRQRLSWKWVGIAGQAGLGAFPDELIGGIPQLDGTRGRTLALEYPDTPGWTAELSRSILHPRHC